jgi:hypothetical protein
MNRNVSHPANVLLGRAGLSLLTPLFLAALLLIFSGPRTYGFSAIDTNLTIATDGTVTDTAAALAYIADKNQDGWVVTIGLPGAHYTWPIPLTISLPHVVTIQGASAANPPTITSTSAGGFGIMILASSGKTITVKNLAFNEWSSVNGLFLIKGIGLDCFHLTGLQFYHSSGTAIGWVSDLNPMTGEGPYGLIDHCTNMASSSGYGFYIRQNQGAGSWQNPMSFGTSKAVYIEDCSFLAKALVAGRPAIDGDNGARWVFRYCSLTNYTIGNHGADSGGSTNSCLQFEIMHNTFTVCGGQGQDFCMFNRGGTGIMFSNTIVSLDNSGYNSVLKMGFFRAAPGNGVCAVDRVYPQDYLGTQQPGMGVSPGTQGLDPHFPNQPWVSVPVYFWGNTVSAQLWQQ